MYHTNAPLCKLFLTDTAWHCVAYASVRPHPRHVHYGPTRVPVRLPQRVKLSVQAHALAVASFSMRAKLLDNRGGLTAILADRDDVPTCYKYGCETKLTESR